MSELKTRATDANVEGFLDTIADDARRQDCVRVLEIMKSATGAEPRMWGPTIVGFGSYHFRYDTGREGDWFLTGFSPRKGNLTLYITAGFDRYESLLSRLGKHKTGKSCLYIKRLADVDEAVLRELVTASVKHMQQTHPTT